MKIDRNTLLIKAHFFFYFAGKISYINPLMPSGSFNICCPRDCVSRTANEKLVTIVANRH